MAEMTRRDVMIGGAAVGVTAFFGPSFPAEASGSWARKASLPYRVQEIYAAVHKGGIWVAGGLSPDVPGAQQRISGRVVVYDPAADEWREGPALPEPRHHPYLLAHEGALYAIGGFGAGNGGRWSMRTAIDRLDGEQWTRVSDLPQPQAETVCASLGGRLHVVTGRSPRGRRNADWNDHSDVSTHTIYDPQADRWSSAAPAPTARNSGAGAVVGGKLYVVGGRTVGGGNNAETEVFDPSTGQWDSRSPMPEGRGGIAAAALGADIYVFGGEYFNADGGGVYKDVFKYDTQKDEWFRLGDMPTPRHGLGAVALNGALYTVAGATNAGGSGTSGALEAYTPG